MTFLLVEKKKHHAVHGIFYSKERAEWFLTNVVPEYVSKGYYMDKTLTVNNFEIIKKD